MNARITATAAPHRVTVTLDGQTATLTPEAVEELAYSLQTARVIRVGSATLGLPREDALVVARGLRATAAKAREVQEVPRGG